MRMILLGAPGSGKGTQGEKLAAALGLPRISTGDALRAAVKSGTDLGRKARAAMDAGDLVADELVVEIVEERLAQPDASEGFILDGFPRNTMQARILDALLLKKRPAAGGNRPAPSMWTTRRIISRLLARGLEQGRSDDPQGCDPLPHPRLQQRNPSPARLLCGAAQADHRSPVRARLKRCSSRFAFATLMVESGLA